MAPFLASLMSAWVNVNTGNVHLADLTDPESVITSLCNALSDNQQGGFVGMRYTYDPATDKFYRTQWEYYAITEEDDPAWHPVGDPVQLSLGWNLYEMFAFCASSVVQPIGTIAGSSLIPGVFSGGKNLMELSTSFNNLNTGHSAEFVHSYLDVGAYWRKLAEDIR